MEAARYRMPADACVVGTVCRILKAQGARLQGRVGADFVSEFVGLSCSRLWFYCSYFDITDCKNISKLGLYIQDERRPFFAMDNCGLKK